MSRPAFTDRRRAMLARRTDALEAMEPRAMITESLGILVLGIGVPAAAFGSVGKGAAGAAAATPRPGHRPRGLPDALSAPRGRLRVPSPHAGSAAGEALHAAAARPAKAVPAGDWLTLLRGGVAREPAGHPAGLAPAAKAPKAAAAGGGSPRGGSGAAAPGLVTALRLPPPAQAPPGAPTAAATGAFSATGGTAAAPVRTAATTAVVAAALEASSSPSPAAATMTATDATGTDAPPTQADPGLFTVLGRLPGGARPTDFGAASGGTAPAATGGARAASFPSFTNFPLYTLDYNDGDVLFPGFAQLGTPGGNVDLRAQVRDTSVLSYSWNTSGLTDATAITGAATARLQFAWNTYVFSTPKTDSVTLTVTKVGGATEVQTYTFRLVNGSGAPGTGTATWPESLGPDLALPAAPSFPSQNVAVAADSGAADAAIGLPAYNPNLPGLALTYDSLTADPRPIVVEHHALDPALSVPTRVSGALTFNGAAGTTYYYDTSLFTPGDVQQIALQADATALSTGRYAYSLAVGDVRGTTTTTTATGTATVLNGAGNAFGAGWGLAGLEKVTAATGGLIVDLGAGGRSLWFTGGGPYASPAGDFSTLAAASGGGYTRTLTDGTVYSFNAAGYETSAADRDGLRVTFAYDGGNRLTTVTDPYAKVTTFAYDGGGKLSTVTDPAGRVATFTHSGANLTGVTLPDSSAWGYAYDPAGRLTQVTDPNSHTVTVAYDGAERAATVTRPDNTAETFLSYQERGWTNTGTSGSPAAATLLAEARATYTDPLGNVTDLRPDWRGRGLPNQAVDPSGNLTTADRDANGLATVTVDPLSRITQTAYDSKGNPTLVTHPMLVTDQYAYNGFAEPTSHTDADGHTTSYAYDASGNLTGVQDPLLNRTTMTYTAGGKLATARDANSNVTSYQYDSQDRLTTVTYPDGSTSLVAYDAGGNPSSATDGDGHATTYAHDAMDRTTGTTDALGNPTTYAYDPAGNQTATQAPLSRTTGYAYDAMNRVTTVTDPLGHATVTAYDSGGRVLTVTDPLGRVATQAYDPNSRPTVVADPLAHLTTSAYDLAGQVTQVTDPLSATTTSVYNSMGWRTSTVDPAGNLVTNQYSNTGMLTTVVDPSSATAVVYGYDNLDRLVSVTDKLYHVRQTVWDAIGNKTATVDGNGNRTSYAYDARNRLTTVTDALGHATAYGYDSGGNRVTARDPLGNVTTTQYDALNRPTTLTDAQGDQTVFVYDRAGRRTAVVDPTGNRTTSGYDAADRLTTLTTPLGTTTYAYDAADERTDRTDADGRRVTFGYDAAGRQTAERWLDASGGTLRTATFGYDNAGRLTGATDPDATLTYTYDSRGNPLTAATSGPAGQPAVTLTSGYNVLDLRTSRADSLATPGLATYAYDLANRLTTITTSAPLGGNTVTFTYDAGDRLTNVARNLTVPTTISYDAAGRVTTITHGGFGMGPTALATYVYGYDNADRLTSERNAEGTVTFGYDASNELTGASGSRGETYSYDSGGNRTMTGYATGADNTLTSGAGYTYAYDAEGNLTGKTQTAGGTAVTTYGYDDRDRLTGVTVRASSGGAVTAQATYTYDAMNRRIGTDVNGAQTWSVYDGANTYADFNGSGAVQTRYLYGPAVDQVLSRTTAAGATAWYLTDKLGTVRDLASASGAAIDHLSYDSYGKVLTETSPANGDRFKFAGREFDAATGLYFNRARYYDPATGRFVSQDPKGFAAGDDNLYRYVTNEPTNATDPGGMDGRDVGLGFPSVTDYMRYLRNPGDMDSSLQTSQQVAVGTAVATATIATGGAAGAYFGGAAVGNVVLASGLSSAVIGGSMAASNGGGVSQIAVGAADGARIGTALALVATPVAVRLVPSVGTATGALTALSQNDKFDFRQQYQGVSDKALNLSIAGQQRQLLGEWMGRGAEGARQAMGRGIPDGLTPESLRAYHELARRAIEANIDTVATQAARLALIEEALSRMGR